MVEKTNQCANCDTPLIGKFCHACGEKKPSHADFAISHFFKELFEKFTHLDSKLTRSLALLVGKPGFLSVEYLRGKRKPYEKPLALFFIINVLYFVSIGFNNLRTYENPLQSQLRNPYKNVVSNLLERRFHGDQAALSAFEPVFDHQMLVLAKSLLLLIVPMYATIFALLFRRKNMYFGEHLVVALHFQALMMVLNMALGIFAKGSVFMWFTSDLYTKEGIAEMIEPFFWNTLIAFLTFKIVYRENWMRLLYKSVLLAAVWLPVLFVYRFIVFLITFYSV